MTDKEKQIAEMVTALHQGLKPLRETYDTETIAEILYDAGYRKQVEGEWKDSDRNGVSVKGYMVCTACDVMIPTCDDGIYCLSRLRYCPNCGAKMSGGKTMEIKSERRNLTFSPGKPAVPHEEAVKTLKEFLRSAQIAEMANTACTSCDYDNNGICDLLVTPAQCSKATCIAEAFYEAGYRKQFDVDFIEVVRCKDCTVPHNKWTGCPNLNGMIPPPEFFCARGERKQKEMKGGESDDRN